LIDFLPKVLVLPDARESETNSEYAEGIREKKYPSRRQQQQKCGVDR